MPSSDPGETVLPDEDLVDKAKKTRKPAGKLNRDEAEAHRTWEWTGLGKGFAWVLLVIMSAQITVADYVFYLYGEANGWEIPMGAIVGWLSATVIQVVAVVVVIARGLFAPLTSQSAPRKAGS